MRLTSTTLFIRYLALCIGMLCSTAGLARNDSRILIISIDGLHPAALSRVTTPTLFALMQAGRFTLKGRSVDPPKTLIAHTAMLTGLSPEQNGKQDNDWIPGAPRVLKSTLFEDAKKFEFRTAFYYAKAKLGYLVGDAVDESGLTPHDGIERVSAFFREGGQRMAVLHLSGLEYAGEDSGWLSADYLAELTAIDLALAPLFDEVRRQGGYAIVVTSDHAGHERQHGTEHPEDFKLPLIVATNLAKLPQLPRGQWKITQLRGLVFPLLRSANTQR